MDFVDTAGNPVPEPDWSTIFSDVLEVAAAADRWRVIMIELRERLLLTETNSHSVLRLVVAYALYDRAAREVAEHGAVTKPRRGNSKAIPRVSPFFTAMREANSDATALEAELGLSPRRRGDVTKAERKATRARAADNYLKVVK